jgi:hypothetical protein
MPQTRTFVTPMKIIATHILIVVAAMAPLSSKADQLKFTGQTRADVPLIKDVLRNVQMIAKARMSCESIESVEATVLPEGEANAQYERWQISLCGSKEDFLVATWRQPNTPGVMFRIGFPFPSAKLKP